MRDVPTRHFPSRRRAPEYNTLLLKSYNVPELTRDEVTATQAELFRCVHEEDGEMAKYKQHLAPAGAR